MGITNQIPPSRLIQPGVVDNAAARPASPFEGQCIFQKDTDQLLVWNGTVWVMPNKPSTNPDGLELIKTQAVGTGVSSVVVTDAFNSTYDNYKIMLSGGSGSNAQAISFKLGASTTGYYQILTYWTYPAGAQTTATVNNGATWAYSGESSPNLQFINIDILEPFNSKFTQFSGGYVGSVAGTVGGYHGVATSYTDFTLAVAGTMTGGTIRVYGYRK